MTVTIDGEHARDFDDAITHRAAGERQLLARRAHRRRRALRARRRRARRGGLRARDVGVLSRARRPHVSRRSSSTGLCSLNPDVDRLVQSCLMEIDRKGTVVRYEIHDGVIHSDARMTYTDVNAILTDRDPRRQRALSRARAAVRDDARALRDPQPPPPPPRLDRLRPEGAGDRARRRGHGRGDHRRRAQRRAPPDRGVHAGRQRDGRRSISTTTTCPTLYRIHEEPDPLKVEEFEEFISTLGYSLGKALDEGHARATSRSSSSGCAARRKRSRSRS